MFEAITEIFLSSLSLSYLGILLSLFALETVLSADNAVALAALVQHMEDPEHQHRALSWGLAIAFALRILLLLTATWVIQFWQFELAGALYLLWLSGRYFWEKYANQDPVFVLEQRRMPDTLQQVIPLIALTDLAFSIDSVTTAVALSDHLGLVVIGCLLGVIALRFLAGLFIELLARFTYLQDAAYLTVLGVALRLLLKTFAAEVIPPDWTVLLLMATLFAWGFSKQEQRSLQISDPDRPTVGERNSSCDIAGSQSVATAVLQNTLNQ